MNEKKIMVLLLSLLLMMGMLSGCNANEIHRENMLDQGTLYSSGGYQRYHTLSEENGGYLSFWVENQGNGPVVLMVNGKHELRVESGTAGEITVPVKDFLFWERDYYVQCVTASGDDVDITYRLNQHN